MCTSFVFRKDNNILVGMNFDNNGMPFSIKKDNKQFVIYVDGGRGKWPSFGINNEGTFINNLLVDSNGKGLYKRASSKVTHVSRFTGDILSGAIQPNEVVHYLENIEIVNSPDYSIHNMIVDKDGNTTIVEPGRGVIYSPASESKFFVMTNFSLCDLLKCGELTGCGTDRYLKAKHILNNTDKLDITGAFELLNQVKQDSGDWITQFSFVYSHKEKTVYYCYNADFTAISNFSFA